MPPLRFARFFLLALGPLILFVGCAAALTPTLTLTPFAAARTSTPPPTRTPLATPTPAPSLGYSRETTWQVTGEPSLAAMGQTIAATFEHQKVNFAGPLETVYGFEPGEGYGQIFVRDTASMMELTPFLYPDVYLRTPLEGFLAQQYTADTVSSDGDDGVRAGPGAISAVLAADLLVNKATATSDDETSLIHCAFIYYDLVAGAPWLGKTIQGETVLARLDAALNWLFTRRLDATTRLVERGYTTDWGDVKAERGGEPTDFNPRTDHRTASIYDQALAYRAARELAVMHRAVGDASGANEWQSRAADLYDRTQEYLWQPARGFFRLHLDLTPWKQPFDEDRMVTVMNALAVQVGLTTPEQTASIFDNLERVRRLAQVQKPGLVLYPPYPAGFLSVQGGQGEYQNGGVWDWWGGMQIESEFANGAAALATEHLRQVAADWSRHPGEIFEWQSPQDLAGHGGAHYASAAGTVGAAIVRGLFGVELSLDGLTLQPRLGSLSGSVRVYNPTTDRYAAFSQSVTGRTIILEYGTNVTTAVALKILLPAGAVVSAAQLDGQSAAPARECAGQDCYAVLTATSGQHRVILDLR